LLLVAEGAGDNSVDTDMATGVPENHNEAVDIERNVEVTYAKAKQEREERHKKKKEEKEKRKEEMRKRKEEKEKKKKERREKAKDD